MKLIALLLWCVTAFAAGPALTTISDTLYNTDGSTFNGTLTIQGWTQTSSGAQVLQSIKTVRVPASAAGAVSFQLVPNPSETPYTFTYSNGAVQYCIIPVSSGAVQLAGLCTTTAPSTAAGSFPLADLNIGSVSNGTYCLQVAGGVVVSLVACSGSGSTLSWSALTTSQWSTLTTSEWSTLTP